MWPQYLLAGVTRGKWNAAAETDWRRWRSLKHSKTKLFNDTWVFFWFCRTSGSGLSRSWMSFILSLVVDHCSCHCKNCLLKFVCLFFGSVLSKGWKKNISFNSSLNKVFMWSSFFLHLSGDKSDHQPSGVMPQFPRDQITQLSGSKVTGSSKKWLARV